MNRKIALLVILIFLAVISCSDILEADISQEYVVLKTPLDSISSSEVHQIFWWDKLEGAASYNIVIASPGFRQPVTLVLDSAMVHTSFSYSLPPGEYDWCVTAHNSAYISKNSCRKIFIVE